MGFDGRWNSLERHWKGGNSLQGSVEATVNGGVRPATPHLRLAVLVVSIHGRWMGQCSKQMSAQEDHYQ